MSGARAVVGPVLVIALVACGSRPDTSRLPSASGSAAGPPTPAPAFGLTWALIEDVERPEDAFALPSDLPTAPSGPGTAGHPGHFPGQAILHDVTVLGDRLVAVGYSATGEGVWTAKSWTSTDGLHWSLSTIDARAGSFAESVTMNAGSILVAVGRSGGAPAAWSSEDGVTWRSATIGRISNGSAGPEPERMTTIWASGRTLWAGGSAGPELGDRRARLWTSEAGDDWTPIPDSSGFDGAEVSAFATARDGTLVALGLVGTGQRKTGSVAWVSRDGTTWSRVDDPVLAGGLAVAATQSADGLLAVGSDGDEREAVAWTSADGRTWIRAPREDSRLHVGEKIRMTDVIATRSGYVGIGNFVGVQYGEGTSWLSIDGLSWMLAPAQPALGQGEPEAVTAWGDRLVMVGSRGAPDNYIPSVWISPGAP